MTATRLTKIGGAIQAARRRIEILRDVADKLRAQLWELNGELQRLEEEIGVSAVQGSKRLTLDLFELVVVPELIDRGGMTTKEVYEFLRQKDPGITYAAVRKYFSVAKSKRRQGLWTDPATNKWYADTEFFR